MTEHNADSSASGIDHTKLPFHDPPADASDVVKEFTKLCTLIAGIMAVNPHGGAALIDDATKEPGRSVAIVGLRVTLALDSFVGNECKVLGELLSEAVVKGVEQSVDQLEQAGFLHHHETPDNASYEAS